MISLYYLNIKVNLVEPGNIQAPFLYLGLINVKVLGDIPLNLNI